MPNYVFYVRTATTAQSYAGHLYQPRAVVEARFTYTRLVFPEANSHHIEASAAGLMLRLWFAGYDVSNAFVVVNQEQVCPTCNHNLVSSVPFGKTLTVYTVVAQQVGQPNVLNAFGTDYTGR